LNGSTGARRRGSNRRRPHEVAGAPAASRFGVDGGAGGGLAAPRTGGRRPETSCRPPTRWFATLLSSPRQGPVDGREPIIRRGRSATGQVGEVARIRRRRPASSSHANVSYKEERVAGPRCAARVSGGRPGGRIRSPSSAAERASAVLLAERGQARAFRRRLASHAKRGAGRSPRSSGKRGQEQRRMGAPRR